MMMTIINFLYTSHLAKNNQLIPMIVSYFSPNYLSVSPNISTCKTKIEYSDNNSSYHHSSSKHRDDNILSSVAINNDSDIDINNVSHPNNFSPPNDVATIHDEDNKAEYEANIANKFKDYDEDQDNKSVAKNDSAIN